MRTRHTPRQVITGGALLVASMVVVTIAATFALTAAQAVAPVPMDATSYRLPAADVARLDDIEFGSAAPTMAIPIETALEIAAREYNPAELGADSVEPYLETITVPATDKSDAPIAGQPVWIVKISGMAIDQPGPITADGTPAEGHTLRVAYVVMDAETGDILYTEWQE